MSAAAQPTNSQPHHRDLPRRTIIKGAAWSVPVIAAAVSVPLASASDVTPPPVATEFFTGVGSGYAAGNYADVQVEGRAGRGLGSIPASTVITLSTSDGAEIVVDSADQVGIASITQNGDGSYTIIPEPGVTKVSLYVTRATAGEIVVLASAGAFSGSASGNWN
ncbi:MAG: hypothetical protein WBA87_06000 [Microbacterium sp.]